MDDSKQGAPASTETPSDALSGYGTSAPAQSPEAGAVTGRQTVRGPIAMLTSVAAFDAGRLWNRLRFHLEQAWFGYGNHRRAARRVLGLLGRNVRYTVPAAHRRGLQEAVTRPIEELFNRIESEEHYRSFEDWTGEFTDEHLSEDDFRRALEPAFQAIAAIQRTIEEKLDGLARLTFDLGELLDQGTCPPNVHRHLGRPRPVLGGPDDESRWRSVMPGEETPDTGWYDDVRQLLIELATGLGLAPDALATEQVLDEEHTGELVDRIIQGVTVALVAFHERAQDGENSPADKASPSPDAPIRAQKSVPLTSVVVEGSGGPGEESIPDHGGPAGERTQEGPHEVRDSPRFAFDPDSRTVVFDGKRFPNLDPFIFKAFRKIHEATCQDRRVTGRELGKGRVGRRLRRRLPGELIALLDSKDGRAGGYILALPPRSPR